MRILVKYVMAAAMVLPLGTLPAAAQAQSSEPDPKFICDYLVSEGAFRNYGDCVSGFRSEAKLCSGLPRETLQLLGFRNVGECVAFMVQNRQS